jgi:carbamoyltransferase
MSYFDYATGFSMTNKKFERLFGGEPREPESNLTQREMDIACSIQKITEEIIIKLARSIAKETGESNLCIAGGVALNCVANGCLLKEKIFDNIWVQPAAGDAGGALGAALSTWFLHFNQKRKINLAQDSMKGSYLGPEFSDDEIKNELDICGAVYTKYSEIDFVNKVASAISKEKAVGWMQGRMEFGPRSLGCRSIIADPRSSIMQKQLNLKIKYRESFRPFAPSIIREYVEDWFELQTDSPYMLFVANIKKNKQRMMNQYENSVVGIDKIKIQRSSVPAITHVDYSSRIQTVHSDTNQLFYNVISRFKEITGCPIVINTSFNIRGEPIVCTPTDAFKCFMGTDLDVLAIGNYILLKEEQKNSLKKNYQKSYELD